MPDAPEGGAGEGEPAPAGAPTVYTIGHSTRSWEDFVALLERHGIRRLVDVRTFPGSRKFPWFGADVMRDALAERGVRYQHLPALGGRRRPSPDAPPTAWRNEGFRGYADYMRGEEFHRGLAALLDIAAGAPTAIMCSEAVPWRCHRNLVSDALVARGVPVRHIMEDRLSPHSLTPFATVADGEVRYAATEPERPAAQRRRPMR